MTSATLTSTPSGALPLPIETTEHALAFLAPRDLALFAQTCRAARWVVYENPDQYVWRELFLRIFDDPRQCPSSSSSSSSPSSPSTSTSTTTSSCYDWRSAVCARTRAESAPREHAPLLVQVLSEAHPCTSDFYSQPSLNTLWLTSLLHPAASTLLADADPLTGERRALSPDVLRLRSYLALRAELADAARLNVPASRRIGAHGGGVAGEEIVGDEAGEGAGLSGRADRGKGKGEDPELERVLQNLDRIRTRSRCFVYNLNHYTEQTNYGPFLPDGTVHWKHVESIVNVITLNLRDLPDLWRDRHPPTGFEAVRAYSAPGTAACALSPSLSAPEQERTRMAKKKSSWEFGAGEEDEAAAPEEEEVHDWAGVQGRWQRFVCFMDYRDLFAFNFSTTSGGPRSDRFFGDPHFMEATRLISMQLSVDHERKLKPEPHPPGYPPLPFIGCSQGSNGNEATVTGSVRMGPDGTVRWSWVHKASNLHGEAQWSSEGVQLGGVCSAMGVVGAWTGAGHEEGDPAGPFWMWKVSDDHPVETDD